MLNQSYTADNFRKIFDYENRKGVYLEGRFFPDIEELSQKLKACATEFRELKKIRSTLTEEAYEEEKEKLNAKKEKLQSKKEELLTAELEKISATITAGNFKIGLSELDIGQPKKAYAADKTPEAYFALKQSQYNLRKLYKVKQSNRYNIICQLKELLQDEFPKFVIRTDIQDFYESIPREMLIGRLNDEALLTSSSKKLISQILRSYTAVSGNTNGVPRGIGISAYLTELYMRYFDEQMRAHEEVIFYARYVDDIIIIYAPKPNSDPATYIDELLDRISKLGLTVNKAKTKVFDARLPGSHKLDFLGYAIDFGTGTVKLGLSKKKLDRYKEKIKLSFEAYDKKSATDEKQARKILIKRIRFLTSNTRLLNNKKRAVVGIFFSNSLLTTTAGLKGLDGYLSSFINKLTSAPLKQRLEKMSFEDGFTQRRFSKFSTASLTKIVRAWRYVA